MRLWKAPPPNGARDRARVQLFSDLAQTYIPALFSHTFILFTSQLGPFQDWLIFMGSITFIPFFFPKTED